MALKCAKLNSRNVVIQQKQHFSSLLKSKKWHRDYRSPQSQYQVIRGARGKPQQKGLAPVEEIVTNVSSSPSARFLVKPFAFTILVGGVSFGACSIWQYESLRKVVHNVRKGTNHAKDTFYGKSGSFRQHANYYWNSLGPGQKVIGGIIGANVLVFCMWRVRALQNFMIQYFASNPLGKAPCWSMLLSNWSHYSMFHIAANMYVLWSFSAAATSLLGKEQFMAFYVTAGTVSGFASYLVKIGRMSLAPSLGASGAIMAVLGAVCSQFPEARLSIAFVDQLIPHSFSAATGMKALIAVDTLGILLGWRLFDHAAHLGGMLFGIWYINYGHKMIWAKREKFIEMWHHYRGKP